MPEQLWSVSSPGSRCGECTLCCTLTAVPELQKLVNATCEHCAVGQGCRIYAVRPASCRAFACLWHERPNAPCSMRPDQCHVVFEMVPNSKIIVALVDPAYPDAWLQTGVRGAIKYLLKIGHPVVVTRGPTMKAHFMIPDGVRPEDVMNEVLERARAFWQAWQTAEG